MAKERRYPPEGAVKPPPPPAPPRSAKLYELCPVCEGRGYFVKDGKHFTCMAHEMRAVVEVGITTGQVDMLKKRADTAPIKFDKIAAILAGIDREECDGDGGWWETSTGAEFGAKKLQEIKALLANEEREKDE